MSLKHDEEHSFPYEVVTQMGQMGLFGLPFPEEYGGMGGDYFAPALALEELGKVDQVGSDHPRSRRRSGCQQCRSSGSAPEEQKQTWLPDLVTGKRLAGFGLTGAGAGSDAGATATTAVADGDEWAINGSKQFITNSGTDITSLVTVTAVTGSRDGGRKRSDDHRAVGHPCSPQNRPTTKVGWEMHRTPIR